MMIRYRNISTGCGTLFPSRSTPSSMRSLNDFPSGTAVAAAVIDSPPRPPAG